MFKVWEKYKYFTNLHKTYFCIFINSNIGIEANFFRLLRWYSVSSKDGFCYVTKYTSGKFFKETVSFSSAIFSLSKVNVSLNIYINLNMYSRLTKHCRNFIINHRPTAVEHYFLSLSLSLSLSLYRYRARGLYKYSEKH